MPLASVDTAVSGLTAPPPDVTANVTDTPVTGLLNWSRTSTAGGVVTAVPTVADCVLPAWVVRCVAASAVAGEVEVTGLARPVEALSVLLPTDGPRVQHVTPPLPHAPPNTAVSGLTAPPPDVTANVTATPATGLSN